VIDLWLPNQQTWNCQLIDMLFQQPMGTEIKQTPIIHSPDCDILCWELTPANNWRTSTKASSAGYYSTFKPDMEEQTTDPKSSGEICQQVLGQVSIQCILATYVLDVVWKKMMCIFYLLVLSLRLLG
jgi:hypothetical protein